MKKALKYIGYGMVVLGILPAVLTQWIAGSFPALQEPFTRVVRLYLYGAVALVLVQGVRYLCAALTKGRGDTK